MTVQQLIALLEQCDSEAEVRCFGEHIGYYDDDVIFAPDGVDIDNVGGKNSVTLRVDASYKPGDKAK